MLADQQCFMKLENLLIYVTQGNVMEHKSSSAPMTKTPPEDKTGL